MRRGWGAMAIGAFVLLFGIYTYSTYDCFVTCTLWGAPISEGVGFGVSWLLIFAGIVILVVTLIVRGGETPKATPFHPITQDEASN